jgi:hypothetical protein
MRQTRLVPDSRIGGLWRWGRINRARQLRRDLDQAPSLDGLSRVAAIGATGNADDELRTIFQTHVYEPPVPVKLTAAEDERPLPETPDRSGVLYAAGSDLGVF